MSKALPVAPYPPAINMSRDRAISFSVTATGSKVSNKISPSVSQSNRSIVGKGHPERVEFYSNSIYGTINCSEGTLIDTQNDASAKDKEKKMGPNLLSLGMFSPHETKCCTRFAISRGNSAVLGAGIASTCLSFRKSYDINGNRVFDTVNDTIYCATGLTTGSLMVHVFKNISKYIPVHVDQDEDAKYWAVLDSSSSEDIKTSVYSYYQPRHHRPSSSVAWGPNSRHVAVGIVSSNVAENSFRNANVRGVGDSQVAFGSGGKDRDYGALVFDVEVSTKAAKSSKNFHICSHIYVFLQYLTKVSFYSPNQSLCTQ